MTPEQCERISDPSYDYGFRLACKAQTLPPAAAPAQPKGGHWANACGYCGAPSGTPCMNHAGTKPLKHVHLKRIAALPLPATQTVISSRDACDVCCGDGVATGGRPCICGGLGTADGERLGLRLALIKAENEIDELKLAALPLPAPAAIEDEIVATLRREKEALIHTVASLSGKIAKLSYESLPAPAGQSDQWMDVNKELPPERKIVLGFFETAGIQLTSWFQWETMENPLWSPGDRMWGALTHWQDLPSKPPAASPAPPEGK